MSHAFSLIPDNYVTQTPVNTKNKHVFVFEESRTNVRIATKALNFSVRKQHGEFRITRRIILSGFPNCNWPQKHIFFV